MKVLPFKTQPKSSLFLKLEPTHDGEGTFVVVCDSSGRVYQNGRILLITELSRNHYCPRRRVQIYYCSYRVKYVGGDLCLEQ
jgi:hypothetical protein